MTGNLVFGIDHQCNTKELLGALAISFLDGQETIVKKTLECVIDTVVEFIQCCLWLPYSL